MDFPAAARALLAELAAIPYENLSKVVARQRSRSVESALDFSATWLEDHRRLGWGGTCFALTHWLKLQMDALGLATEYLMADQRRARNIHCGLLYAHNGQHYLLDPGYLIFEPLPLPQAGLSAVAFACPNAIRVEDDADTGLWRLFSGPRDGIKHRFDFRKTPVSLDEFQRHWEASYQWPMMRYPLLNRVSGGVQYYLQKNNLLVRTEHGGTMQKLTRPEIAETARTTFGLPPDLVEDALEILNSQS